MKKEYYEMTIEEFITMIKENDHPDVKNAYPEMIICDGMIVYPIDEEDGIFERYEMAMKEESGDKN